MTFSSICLIEVARNITGDCLFI